jgi:hypothetical protein
MEDVYTYTGDVDLKYGGAWFNLATFEEGYVYAIRVTDLDSAIGYADAFMIESITIVLDHAATDIAVCGLSIEGDMLNNNGQLMPLSDPVAHLLIAEAVMAYGRYDTDGSETLVIGPDAAMESREGWKADRRLRLNVNLRKLIMREYNIKEG